MKIPSLHSIVAVALLALPAWNASAQVSISTSSSPPAPPLYVSQPDNNGGTWAWNSARPYAGQSFQAPSTATLSEISIKIAGAGTAVSGANFTLSLYESTSRTEIGSVKVSETGSLPDQVNANDYLVFQFQEEVSLVEGNFYTFILSGNNLPSTFITFATGNTAGLTGDRWSSTDGSAFTRNATSSIEFHVTVIPEASAAWLFGLAVPIFFAMRPRRRHAA